MYHITAYKYARVVDGKLYLSVDSINWVDADEQQQAGLRMLNSDDTAEEGAS